MGSRGCTQVHRVACPALLSYDPSWWPKYITFSYVKFVSTKVELFLDQRTIIRPEVTHVYTFEFPMLINLYMPKWLK